MTNGFKLSLYSLKMICCAETYWIEVTVISYWIEVTVISYWIEVTVISYWIEVTVISYRASTFVEYVKWKCKNDL